MMTAAPLSQNAARILLVEDHAPNALVLGIFLEEFGYPHDVAENGLKAVEKFLTQSYQVILMDIEMPEMNGYEATRRIRAEEAQRDAPPTHIIGMTAHVSVDDRDQCLAAGMNDYIGKPFKPDELQSKLKNLCHSA